MKSFLTKLIILITALLSLQACKKNDEPDAPSRRTVLVYMEARNDLSSNAYDDLCEIKLADIPADCRVLVYYSKRGIEPKLLEIVNGHEVILKLYPEETSAIDPQTMREVISTAQTLAPALEYGLILWSHSSGWMESAVKSRGFGLENGREQMPIPDLAYALQGLGLDFLLFDTCYMGCVEVAYELRNAARFMVASVCEVTENGMPYDRTIPQLLNSDMVLGLKNTIDITVSANATFGGCPATLSLIDLSKMNALAQAVKNAPNELPADYSPQVFSISSPYKYLFFDFGQYFDTIGGDPVAKNNAILYERHSSSLWGEIPLTHCSGLSIYIPTLYYGYDINSYGYSSLEWYKYIYSTN